MGNILSALFSLFSGSVSPLAIGLGVLLVASLGLNTCQYRGSLEREADLARALAANQAQEKAVALLKLEMAAADSATRRAGEAENAIRSETEQARAALDAAVHAEPGLAAWDSALLPVRVVREFDGVLPGAAGGDAYGNSAGDPAGGAPSASAGAETRGNDKP